jgi:hypothetical protein
MLARPAPHVRGGENKTTVAGDHIRPTGLSPVVYSEAKELCYAGHSASCFHREAS